MNFLYAIRAILFLFYGSLLCIMIVFMGDLMLQNTAIKTLEDYIFFLPLFSLSVLAVGFFKVWNKLSIWAISAFGLMALSFLLALDISARTSLAWLSILGFAAFFEAIAHHAISKPISTSNRLIQSDGSDQTLK